MRRCFLIAANAVILCAFLLLSAAAQEKPGTTFTIGGQRLAITAPAGWTQKEPATRIVEAEFAIPPAQGDQTPGRLTAMAASGSVEQNVDRWVGQFVGPGGASPKPQRDKLTVGDSTVDIIDLAGTYKDMPGGPFAGGKTINRENYRMLGAIIQTKEAGNYFLKLYGPKATIDANAQGFHEMVKSVKLK